MKRKVSISIGLLLFVGASCLSYIFVSMPSREEVEESLASKVAKSESPDKNSYDSLVRIEKANNRTFLLNEASYAEIWDNKFPFSRHKFNLNQTERVLRILNDSSTYDWGEIGTPYFDKTIYFFGKNKDIIGYTVISFDGQTYSFPYRTLTKWGLLSDRGFRDLLTAIRTE